MEANGCDVKKVVSEPGEEVELIPNIRNKLRLLYSPTFKTSKS